MISVTDYLVPLYLGQGFERSATLLKIFSLLIIVVGLNNAVGKQVLMPVGRQTDYNRSVIIGAFVNFGLNLILIPRFYSVGAVIASVAAETSILLAFIYYSRDYIRLKWIIKASVKYLAAAAIMAAANRAQPYMADQIVEKHSAAGRRRRPDLCDQRAGAARPFRAADVGDH